VVRIRGGGEVWGRRDGAKSVAELSDVQKAGTLEERDCMAHRGTGRGLVQPIIPLHT
jgi:hypothetical protein